MGWHEALVPCVRHSGQGRDALTRTRRAASAFREPQLLREIVHNVIVVVSLPLVRSHARISHVITAVLTHHMDRLTTVILAFTRLDTVAGDPVSLYQEQILELKGTGGSMMS